jgi:aldehyde dehydrogenase (NAD+)
MTIAQEEIFGPVLAVIPYDTEDDAIRIANDSVYGLAGSVWTTDNNKAIEIAKQIRTGTYAVNMYGNDPGAPFGGTRTPVSAARTGPRASMPTARAKASCCRSATPLSSDPLPRSA